MHAAIQLFAAGDSAHAGVVPYVACQLTQVVRNLPRVEKPQSGELHCGCFSVSVITNDPFSGHNCTNKEKRYFI